MNIMTSQGMLNIPTSKDDVYSRGVLKYDVTVDLYILSLLKKNGSKEQHEIPVPKGEDRIIAIKNEIIKIIEK